MTRRAWMLSGASAVVVLVLLWVTNAGAVHVLDPPKGGFLTLTRPTQIPQTGPTGGNAETSRPIRPAGAVPSWIGTVVHLLLLAVALVALAFLVRVLLRWVRDKATEAPPPPAEPFEAIEVSEAVLADADEQMRALEGGSPRNAIVACWVRVEQSAAHAGLARRPSETSTQFTMRMLHSQATGATAITRLASLYREARFSQHEMSEADRDQARASLAVVHDAFRRARDAREAERMRAAAAHPTGTSRTGERGQYR